MIEFELDEKPGSIEALRALPVGSILADPAGRNYQEGPSWRKHADMNWHYYHDNIAVTSGGGGGNTVEVGDRREPQLLAWHVRLIGTIIIHEELDLWD